MRRSLIIACLTLLGCSSEVGDSPAIDGGPGASDGGGADGGVASAGPETYGTDRTLSPITPGVADNLRAIAASAARDEAVFAKVGASATVSINFLHCLASGFVDLDGRTELRAAIDHFAAGGAGGTTPFERDSLSATVGWSAGAALAGDPSPLDQELAAIDPRFAVIMYGTNDIQQGDLDRYGDNLLEMADQLIAGGVIPVFTSIMPRDDSATADTQVPRYNLVVRGVAQSRQVPFIDFHRELVPLPDHGLGADGIHPTVYRDNGVARACHFTAAGLAAGYNIRNLLTLETLERLRHVVVAGGAAPDAPARTLAGAGRHADPFVIAQLPFTHVANTRESLERANDLYSGCNADQDESGAEYVYRLDVTATTTIRAFIADRGTADIDLHLLTGGTDGASCVMRDHRELVAELAPGTHYLVLDTFTSGGTPQEGEYLLFVMEEP